MSSFLKQRHLFPVCASACPSGTIPVTGLDACNVVRHKGGIFGLIIVKCDAWEAAFGENGTGIITEVADWQPLVDNCDVRFLSPLAGNKDAGSETKAQFESCTSEEVTGKENTLNLTLWQWDNEGKAIDFLNAILYELSGSSYMAWVECDSVSGNNNITGWFNYAGSGDRVIPLTNKENQSIPFRLIYQFKEIEKPIQIPGLIPLLQANTNTVCATPYGS